MLTQTRNNFLFDLSCMLQETRKSGLLKLTKYEELSQALASCKNQDHYQLLYIIVYIIQISI